MASGFFFYDLETSGLDPRQARIMQFAGQRTTMDLEPDGDPVNILLRLPPDVVPDPDAIMITGITPQATLAEGVTEANFLKKFYETVVCADTIFLGYNSIRFDDEFMRFLHYRNFYDAYRWQWCDSCSRWDILDVVRMTRALRPEGIIWPYAADGTPTNRLELLTKLNHLDHFNAHDALSDVNATIAVTKLIYDKQPKLFQYLLAMRDKKKVAALVGSGEPFSYTSGSYASEYEKTTLAVSVANLPQNNGALVYDLRYDPTPFSDLTVTQLVERWRWRKSRSKDQQPLPVKDLRFNRCPAVAPAAVVDAASEQRIGLRVSAALQNAEKIKHMAGFAQKLLEAYTLLEQERSKLSAEAAVQNVDGKLYDGFLDQRDHEVMETVRAAEPSAIAMLDPMFHDARLAELWPLYKARNYPEVLNSEERSEWEAHCNQCLTSGGVHSRLAKYFNRLQELAKASDLTDDKRFLIEELRLYGESIMPVNDN